MCTDYADGGMYFYIGESAGMAKKTREEVKPPFDMWFAAACMFCLIVWQGAYFPIQFLLMLALIALALVLRQKPFKTALPVLPLLGISALYFISFALLSENRYAGLTEALRTLAMPMSLMFFLNTDAKRNERIVLAGLLTVAALGLLAYFGIIALPGGVIAGSNRLQSTIQYANTTALLMLIGALYATRDFIEKKRIASLIYGIVFLTALALTGSRATFAISLATGALYAFIRVGKKGKLIVAAAALVTGGTVIALSAIPTVRLLRLSLYEPTLVERWITFGDALKALRGRLPLGIGAANWQTWQYANQSAPYNVKYIHNYYLQLLLDGGIAAPLLFVTALVPSVARGLRRGDVHACIIVAVMLHALVDFDLIFTAAGAILMLSLSQLPERKMTWNIVKFRYIVIAPLLALMSLWISETLSIGADRQLENGKLDKAMGLNETALVFNPLNTGLYYNMAQSTRDIALTEDLLRKSLELNPKDFRSAAILARISAADGNYAVAVDLAQQINASWRYSEEYQTLYRDIIAQARKNGALNAGEEERRLNEIEQLSKPQNPLYEKYIDTS
jgi:O-antigen ligase